MPFNAKMTGLKAEVERLLAQSEKTQDKEAEQAEGDSPRQQPKEDECVGKLVREQLAAFRMSLKS